MNDFAELEAELKKLRPVQPSENLTTRIERALAGPSSTISAGVFPRERRVQINPLALGLGLAAATVFLILARVGSDHPVKKVPAVASITPAATVPSTKSELVPAGLTQVVYSTRNEGLHFPAGSEQPMRRLRSQTRETLQWRNPNTGASLRVSYPSEEVSLIPVSGQ